MKLPKRLYGIGMGVFLLAVFVTCQADDCDNIPTSDETQHAQQEMLNQQATKQTGMPAITHFRERKMLKEIYEMRDRNLTTYTYFGNELEGKVGDKLCDSIGFPVPGGTEYTNPDVMIYGGQGLATLPQADPNALFSPATAEGTYIMCVNPHLHGNTGPDTGPVYSEPKLITSPFPLK